MLQVLLGNDKTPIGHCQLEWPDNSRRAVGREQQHFCSISRYKPGMPPRSKLDPVYEPDPEAPQEPLPPPPGMPKRIKLRWIENLRFEEVSEDSEPEYIDTDE